MGCTQIGPMCRNCKPIRAPSQASFHEAFRQGLLGNLSAILQNLSKSWVLGVFWRILKHRHDGMYANRTDAPKLSANSSVYASNFSWELSSGFWRKLCGDSSEPIQIVDPEGVLANYETPVRWGVRKSCRCAQIRRKIARDALIELRETGCLLSYNAHAREGARFHKQIFMGTFVRVFEKL